MDLNELYRILIIFLRQGNLKVWVGVIATLLGAQVATAKPFDTLDGWAADNRGNFDSLDGWVQIIEVSRNPLIIKMVRLQIMGVILIL